MKKQELDELKLRNILCYNYLAKRFKSDKYIGESLLNLKKTDDFEEIEKVIVIVGAGASLGAGLMLGNQAKMELIEMVTKKSNKQEFNISRSLIIKELRKNLLKKGNIELSVSDGDDILKFTDFETVIETLSQFIIIEEKIKEKLKSLFCARHNPILTYEIIAHMFKYKMIDGIINFNFDELLDQSIEEEMISDKYIKIIGGNDFREYNKKREEIINSKNKGKGGLQFYMKPHGTFSDTESIRSTKSSYVNNSSFNKIIKSELNGKITFLVIGFDMSSVELNSIISKNCQKGDLEDPQFFFINKGRFKKFEEKIFLESYNPEKKGKKSTTINTFYPYQKKFDDFDKKQKRKTKQQLEDSDWHDKISPEILLDVFEDCREHLKSKYDNYLTDENLNLVFPIWDIDRHKILYNLFGNLVIKDREKYKNVDDTTLLFKDYFYLRVLIELLFAISKGRSMINIIGLSKNRLGLFYELYFKNSKKPESLLKICQDFGLITPTYSQEILMIKEKENPFLSKVSSTKSFNILLSRLYILVDNRLKNYKNRTTLLEKEKRELKNAFQPEEHIKLKEIEILKVKKISSFLIRFISRLKKNEKELIKYLVDIFEAKPEIGHSFPTGNHLIFDEECSIDIYSYEQMSFYFSKALSKYSKYDTVLYAPHIPDETWLSKIVDAKERNKINDKEIKFLMIHENTPVNKSLMESPKNYVKILNWWEHKRNSFILLKDKKPVFAIYYYHGSKSQIISPIVIDNMAEKSTKNKEAILSIILQNFISYYIKSNRDESIQLLFNEKDNLNLLDNNIFFDGLSSL